MSSFNEINSKARNNSGVCKAFYLGLMCVVLTVLAIASSVIKEPFFDGYIHSIFTDLITTVTAFFFGSLLYQIKNLNKKKCIFAIVLPAVCILGIGFWGSYDKSIVSTLQDFALPYALGGVGAGLNCFIDLIIKHK